MRLNPGNMMIDGGGEVSDSAVSPTPTASPVATGITVAQGAAAGASGDYSNLSKIMKDPAAYQAFKDARLERVKQERVSSTPKKIVPTTQGTPISSVETVSGTGGGGGNTNATTPNATPPTPTVANTVSPTSTVKPITKTAPIDTVLFNDDLVPIEVMTDLIFENIGGQELINIARNDIINGQKISYNPIKNLSSIQERYNPNNIISLQSTSDKIFSNFSIKLNEKIPNVGNGPNESNVYIDEATGNLVVETINNGDDEQVEIQIAIRGTIYEADI
jgi:hypothetical protein